VSHDSPRYERQKRLSQVGAQGQQRLGSAAVAVIGLGALGSVASDLLVRAGVGALTLIDRDVVDWSNLGRQILFDEEDARRSRPKAEAAARRLRRINSETALRVEPADLAPGNLMSLLQGAGLLLDGSDNFETRYLLNDYAVREGIPYIYAGAVGTYGMVGAFVPGGPCLRCTYPEAPPPEQTPTCRTAGVLGPVVSVIGGLAAAEAMKWLTGHPEDLFAGYRYLDVWSGEIRSLHARADPDCPCCARRDFAWLEGRRGRPHTRPLCGGNTVQVPPSQDPPDLVALGGKLEGSVDGLEVRSRYLKFRDGELDLVLFADGRILVRGTEDPGRARALVARTLGS